MQIGAVIKCGHCRYLHILDAPGELPGHCPRCFQPQKWAKGDDRPHEYAPTMTDRRFLRALRIAVDPLPDPPKAA